MKSVFYFFSYHNAVPIALGVLFLGGASAFAAANPEVILNTEQSVISIDNTYIANVDLDSFTPRVQVTSVTEDNENYYVAYTSSTIALVDYVWQDVTQDKEITVSKKFLGDTVDLGLYVTEQLKQNIAHELRVLRETQTLERQQVTNKQVATVYSGLVGILLSDKTEVFPGYTPIVVPPTPPPSPPSTAAVPYDGPPVLNISHTQQGEQGTQPTQSADDTVPSSTHVPTIQVLGKNPARIAVGSTYSDLGAIVTDRHGLDLSVKKFVNGKKVAYIYLDTSTTTIYEIVYQATDNDGNTSEAKRIVIVYDQNISGSDHPEISPIPIQVPPQISPTAQSSTQGVSTPAPEPTQPEPSTLQSETTSGGADTTTPPVLGPAATSTTTTTLPAPIDTTPPTITLLGDVAVIADRGDVYTDAGATANDDTDGDITSYMVIVNSVDTATVGDYTVTYNVSDSAGNSAEQVERVVTIIEPSPPSPASSATTTGATSTPKN